MKKWLIITDGFYPFQSPRSFRSTELAKEFSRKGHKVTVMAPYREGTEEYCNLHGIDYKNLGSMKWQSVVFSGNSKWLNFLSRGINRFLLLIFEYPAIEFFFKVRNALKKEKENYDALLSVAVPYPIHWGVAARNKQVKEISKIWIADCGDPYVGRENDSFPVLFHFHWIEKWFCRKVDFITVPTEGSLEGYFPEFKPKLRIIPQGFNFEETKRIVKEAEIKKTTKKSDKQFFAYAGLFIPGKRDPREFIEYILSTNHNFEFHIYTQSADILNTVKLDQRIIVHNFIPRKVLLGELSKMDFLVNFSNFGSKQTPSKLIDYALLGKPVLEIETNNLNKDNVDRFLDANYSNRLIIEHIERYNIHNVASKFEDLLKV